MKGRKVSDGTARIVRELRHGGFSLRQIARRARTSKSTVYRLTKGISWEEDSLQPKHIETERILTGDGTDETARRAVTLQVPRAKVEAAGEILSWMDVARTYYVQSRISRHTQTRIISPLRSRDTVQERHMPATVQSREESELDEAKALLRRMPRAAEIYRIIDAMTFGDAMRSKDPLRTYRELRRKALAPAASALLLDKMRHLQTP
jgi:hypothetical protein